MAKLRTRKWLLATLASLTSLLAVGFYALLLPIQGRALERRELDILEAVTGRGGGGDEQITG